jgi:peptide/nickel transport system substrate-binding protein
MHRSLFSLVAVVALVMGACSNKSSTTAPTPASTNGTLNLAYLADMSVPDPDVFYDIEGNTVILSNYEGLVDYRPDTTTIEPKLATSWDISPDGLAYTFHLRSGVTFADGTPFNAAAVKTSFQRRVNVNSAPAYMLAQVADMQTPDPMTFVVKLKSVVTPFMDYMASSWGPKVISPKALADNAGNDFAQTWAKTNADGTGPFKLTAFNRGQNYTLTRNDTYWGPKPNFATVNIRIIPDMNSQILQLRSGGLDVILHSFPVAELPTAKNDPNLAIKDFSSYLQSLLYINVNKAPFSNLDLRKALAADIDRDTIVSQIYSSYGHPAGSTYAPGILDQSLAPIVYPTATVKVPAGTPAITFAYTSDESGIQTRLAQLIQQKLQAQGFQVTLKEVTNPQVYGYAANAQSLAQAPDILLMTNTPDAAHPDTWARILWGTGGGLNFLGYSNPQVDTLLNQGAATTDAGASAKAYGKAGQLLVADYGILFLADTRDVMVMRKNLTDVEHVPNYPWALRLGTLARS